MNILGLIPARGGSKAITRKNIAPLAGRPLIAYTIEAALQSERLGSVVVSTDDDRIRKVALGLGAQVPFARPADVSGDDASALAVMRHAVEAPQKDENWRTDLIVYLQPTSPFRTHLRLCIRV
jgi:CMP-N-acetylneuraminic acid synthetase